MVSTADGGTQVVPLYKLIGNRQPVMLRSTGGEYSIPLPVSAREAITGMSLNLRFTNSAALLRDRSQIFVRLNGRTIAQFPLLAQIPEGNYDIELPVETLKVGYNQLTIGVVQHYTDLCEDPTAPELWTEIDTIYSSLKVTSELKSLTPRLSDLADLIDAKQWHPHAMTIVTPTASMTSVQLNAGAQAAQGVALRLDFLPIAFKHASLAQVADAAVSDGVKLNSAAVGGSDLIVIGTKSELTSVLPSDVASRIGESYLGIFALPGNAKRFALVISGTSEKGVSRAAKAFSFMNFPYPDREMAVITKVGNPPWQIYADKQGVFEKGRYLFKDLGYKTKTVKGMLTEQIAIEFRLPPDYFVDEADMFEFRLRLAYGAGFRRDSVLSLYANSIFQSAVQLNEERGAEYQDYRLLVSARSFKPGVNQVVFRPVMIPLISDECELINVENLLLTIHDDSILIAPEIKHFVRMPNLTLFSKMAFPYSVPADGTDAYVFVTASDSQTVAAGWSVMGKLAQRRGAPLFGTELGFVPPEKKLDKDILIVGSHSQIPSALLTGSPFAFDKSPHEVSYPTLASRNKEDQKVEWYEEVMERLSQGLIRPSGERAVDMAKVHQFDGIGDYTIAVQYESPLRSGRTVTAIFAASPKSLDEGVKDLLAPKVWDLLRGDISMWKRDLENVVWLKTGPEYNYGQPTTRVAAQYFFSKNPWIWFLIVFFLLIIPFSILSRRLYKGYRNKKEIQIAADNEKAEEMETSEKV